MWITLVSGSLTKMLKQLKVTERKMLTHCAIGLWETTLELEFVPIILDGTIMETISSSFNEIPIISLIYIKAQGETLWKQGLSVPTFVPLQYHL